MEFLNTALHNYPLVILPLAFVMAILVALFWTTLLDKLFLRKYGHMTPKEILLKISEGH